VPVAVSVLAISFFWIFLAREDLYWYVVALSFIPLVLWLLDSKTSANNMVVRAVLAGLIFVISNYLALTSIYLAAFVVAYVVIVGLGQSSTEQKKLAGGTLIFTLVVFLGSIPTYLALTAQVAISARTDEFYYDYGLLGSLLLIQRLNLYFLPALLVVLWFAISVFSNGRFTRVLRYQAGGLVILFAAAYLSQFYGFLGPILADQFGIHVGVPLQRFHLLLPLGTALLLPILVTKLDGHFTQVSVNLAKPLKQSFVAMLVIAVAVTPLFLQTKQDHIEGWFENSNLAWAKSNSWKQIAMYKDDYRVAVITSQEAGLLPGHAQLAGFMTAGGDETSSRFLKSFWMEADRSIEQVPEHSLYFGWTNEDKFRNERLEDLLNLDLLAKSGVRFVVSSFPLASGKAILLEPASLGEQVDALNSNDIGVGGLVARKLEMLRGGRGLNVYELPNAKPRIWFASSVEQDPARFSICMEKLNCVFVDDGVKLNADKPARPAASSFRPISGGWAVEISQQGPGLLVLNESWSPGWEARVDGIPVPIIRVNHNFQAVELKGGARSVTMTYVRIPQILSMLADRNG